MSLRLAVIVSHPIQHFAPWHQEVAKLPGVELKVFFCCDWGIEQYHDPDFNMPVQWDIPLVEGYAHQFLPIRNRPEKLDFWSVDNPEVGKALDEFNPDVVQLFGYARRTNWRVLQWANRRGCPVLLYSDSNANDLPAAWKRIPKDIIVRHFYKQMSGALYVGDNNLQYHLNYGIPQDRLFPCVLPIDRRRLLARVGDRAAARIQLRKQMGIPEEAFLVMFCGKYITRKRPLDVVHAGGLAAQRGYPVWVVLVGEGVERQSIEAFCQQEAVSNVTLTSFVNQEGIANYFAASDVLAVSSARDPHPLVVTEGASFGLPVIISDRVGCVGNQDTAQPDRNAIVYPCGDVDRLAAAIQLLYNDQQRYQRMSLSAVQISEGQDVTVAAQLLIDAAQQLYTIGQR